MASLKCLLSLFLQCDCKEEHVEPRQDQRYLLGRTLATFLPGISRALSQVISGDIRQGHAVTMKAMRVWYKAVGLVMADEQLQKTDIDRAAGDLGRVEELVVKRNPSWRKATSQRLAIILQKIISCTSAHPHWRIRLELVNLSHLLLSQCSQSVGECVGPLLEALVGAINDEEPEVKNRCNAALDEVAQKGQSGGQDFTDVLSENLHSLASSLPRLMRTSDDQRKLFVLNVFLGYLKILGPKVDAVLRSVIHLERISKALMQVMELDVTDVKIIEERTLKSSTDLGPDLHQVPSQRKYFLYFTDERIFSALRKICRMLGYYGNLYLLVDRFMELYKESSVYRKQAALVLNEVIAGAAGIAVETDNTKIDCSGINQSRTNHEDLKSSIMSIIEEYISLSNWHLPTVSEALEGKLEITSLVPNYPERSLQLLPASKTPTLHQLNSNIWQICIQLEGIGGFALALGTDFRLLLMTSLYPVLEKAGDESLLVSQAAFNAMCDLCKACDYSSPKELVIKNSDYLLNDVSLNLARPSIHPHAPRVLAVMFTHSDASLLPLVADVVQDVLMALDLSYDQRTPQFCSVLHLLMKALVRWFPGPMGHQKPSSKDTQNKECVNLRQFLLDYKKQKELAEGIGVEEEDPNELDIPPPDEDMEGPAEKKELPLHIQIAKDVMERCIHLLSDSNLRIRLKVLDILELCVCVLCEQEDELLPMVHRCWPALLHRLTNDDPLAVPRAFKVLCVLGESCGDFLRKRVSKEVLPRLTSSLMKQAEISARSGPVYTQTLAYKLQLAVLQGLGPLCVKLDLMEADLDRVSDACLPYLSCRQPIKLQEACLSVFRSLMELDADMCWFTLNELFCPVAYEPPHPQLLPVTLSGSDKPRNQFTDNVLKLLQEFDSPRADR